MKKGVKYSWDFHHIKVLTEALRRYSFSSFFDNCGLKVTFICSFSYRLRKWDNLVNFSLILLCASGKKHYTSLLMPCLMHLLLYAIPKFTNVPFTVFQNKATKFCFFTTTENLINDETNSHHWIQLLIYEYTVLHTHEHNQDTVPQSCTLLDFMGHALTRLLYWWTSH